ncbi:MAG: hypothetical protein K1X94_29245 [Sandaracinaceae bacterium]|nr:hypothetical protein [Sandaracinaceae bacterium]
MSEPITTWKETIAEGEEAMLEKVAADLGAVQSARDATLGSKNRSLHFKQHAGLRARLDVEPGLGGAAAQGLFAKAGTYDAYVRFSNGGGRDQHDKEPDLRGLAIKVLGVEGPKALGDARTQDFLFIDVDALPFRDPREFVSFVQSASSPLTLPFKLFGRLGFRAFGLIVDVAKMAKGNRGSLLDLAYHTVAPHAWGPYAARLHLEPLHQPSPHARPQPERDYLRRELAPRVRAGGVAFALQAQLLTDPSDSVEDVSKPWNGPSVRVGTLTLLADDLASEHGRDLDAHVRALSFDPWHALAAHRPIGLTMRARKHAYFVSTQARSASAEPDGSEWSRFGG